MQLDSGLEASVVPQNLWEQIAQKPRLRPVTVFLKQFHGSQFKAMGQLEALIEMDEGFVTGNVAVAKCQQQYGFLETDILNILDYGALSVGQVNNVTDVPYIGCLNNFHFSSKNSIEGDHPTILL